MIKAVIFDCFGVLTTDLWQKFVYSLPEDQRSRAHELNHAYDGGFITHEEFMTQIRELTGKTPREVEATRNSEGIKDEELLDYIRELKKNYKIGLLSNVATNWIREVLLDKNDQALFDDMIMSFEVKLTKPDPKIFELAASRLDVLPAEVVFIDDIERYCTVARDLGMQAIVYKGFAQMKSELEKILARG